MSKNVQPSSAEKQVHVPYPDSVQNTSFIRPSDNAFLMRYTYVFAFLLLSFFTRSILMYSFVTVHDDERHYAVDGMWVKAKLPSWIILRDVLYRHANPHPFYNPRTDQLGYHGKIQKGYPKGKGGLGPFRRGGHPPLYMLLLGMLYYFLPQTWLIAGDNLVHVARVFNIALDLVGQFFIFDILWRYFGKRLALVFLVIIGTLPYTLIYGSLAYLDSPGTLFATLSIWFYLKTACYSEKLYHWLILACLVLLSVLIKQSNLIVMLALPGVMLIFPPHLSRTKLWTFLLWAAICAGIIFFIFSSPKALYRETRRMVLRMDNKINPSKAFRQLALPFQPKKHYHIGRTRHNGRPYVKSRLLIRIYEVGMPLIAAVIYLSAFTLIARRGFRAAPLILTLLLFVVAIPLGSHIRRLYILVPFAVLIVAMTFSDVLAIISNQKDSRKEMHHKQIEQDP